MKIEIDPITKYKAYLVIAHEICGAVHPEFQFTMTGVRLDGEFVVSCATHKMIATSIVDKQIAHELGVDTTASV
jgi:hypothetical protein